MKFYIGKTALALFWATIKRYIAAVMATKADKAETLAGYGIQDAYKKTEVDTLIANSKQGGVRVANYGFAGVVDVEIQTVFDAETNSTKVVDITQIDEMLSNGMYRLKTGAADSILSIEAITEDYVMQYVMVGGYVGINTSKFIYRVYSNGEWSEWTDYDFQPKKQDLLSSGKTVTIRIGDTLLHLTEPKLQKLKTFLEEE